MEIDNHLSAASSASSTLQQESALLLPSTSSSLTSTGEEDYVAFYAFAECASSLPYGKDAAAELEEPIDYGGGGLRVLEESFQPAPCAVCGAAIETRHMLAVGALRWHETCLRCCQCSSSLEKAASCFVREEEVYCKACYDQEFSTKCAGCDRAISSSDWVRRARERVYHIACFGCNQCKRQLSTGEEFAVQESKLLCKQHYMELVEGDSAISKQKTKRVRTTFTDEQINVLQTHFNIDSNPDGADLERIAQQTGLSKRVTQVWFQNSRARQKKYSVKKPGHHGGHTDSLPSSSEEPLSPRSEASSEDCGMFPHSVTTNMDDSMCGPPMQQQPQHRMDLVGMGLRPIVYD